MKKPTTTDFLGVMLMFLSSWVWPWFEEDNEDER